VRRIIVVGLGARAREWLPHLASSGAAEVVAYVEPNRATAQTTAHGHKLDGQAIYASLADARAAYPEADSIFDIVTPAARETVVTEALAKGFHVLSEKPLAPTLDQAHRLLERARVSRKTWMISQDYRFAALPRASRRIVESGRLGEIGVISLWFWKTARFPPDSFYAQIDHPLLTDMMVHHIDMVRYVTGLDISSLRATAFQPRWSWFKGHAGVTLTAEMTNGAHFTHTGVWCSHGKNTTWNGDWHLEANNGGLTWTEDSLHVYGPPDINAWDVPQTHEVVPEDDSIPESILREFDAAIDEGREPECSAHDNFRSIGAIYAALESITNGGARVDLESYLGLDRGD
jgi:predicted dehydrogenase